MGPEINLEGRELNNWGKLWPFTEKITEEKIIWQVCENQEFLLRQTIFQYLLDIYKRCLYKLGFPGKY